MCTSTTVNYLRFGIYQISQVDHYKTLLLHRKTEEQVIEIRSHMTSTTFTRLVISIYSANKLTRCVPHAEHHMSDWLMKQRNRLLFSETAGFS